jgi:hypothetical protein
MLTKENCNHTIVWYERQHFVLWFFIQAVFPILCWFSAPVREKLANSQQTYSSQKIHFDFRETSLITNTDWLVSNDLVEIINLFCGRKFQPFILRVGKYWSCQQWIIKQSKIVLEAHIVEAVKQYISRFCLLQQSDWWSNKRCEAPPFFFQF